MDLDQSMMPGCFGIGLLYRPDTSECNTCPFAARCEPVATEQLASLRAELGIKLTPSKPKRSAPVATSATSPAPAMVEAALPPPVQRMVDAIERAGVKAVESFAKGINPFTGKMGELAVAGHVLLKRRFHGTNVDELAWCFQQAFGIGAGVAKARAFNTLQALAAIGALVSVDGRFMLRIQ